MADGSDTPDELELDDLSQGRSTTWYDICDNKLGSEEGCKRLQKFVQRFKRKGGEDGKPGDFEALCDELVEALGESENESRESLVRFLEGEETWQDEMEPIFNALEPSDRKKFYRVLNKVKWMPDTGYGYDDY